MIKVLIADDEKHALMRLKKLLSSEKNISIVSEARNGDEVISEIIKKKPDVAILDINMPGTNVFTSIPELKNPPLIIFQSAYSEHALNAFNINAADYILKPVEQERLSAAINKIKKILDKEEIKSTEKENNNLTSISVKTINAIKIIPLNEIYKITFENGFSFVYTTDGKFLSDKYLNFYEKMLKKNNFIRVNRNNIINSKFISVIHPMFKGSYEVELKNNFKIKVSRRKITELKKTVSF